MYPSSSLLIQFTAIFLTTSAIAIGGSCNSCHAQANPNSQDSAKDENSKQKPLPSAKSYLGIGGTLGLSGDTTSLGTGGFSILTRHVLNDLLSVHGNTVVFGSATSSGSMALTLNLPIRDASSQEIVISPFLGAGAQVRNDGNLYVNPMVVGGLDVPLSKAFTGTIRLEAGFPNTGKADLGLAVGIGYNF